MTGSDRDHRRPADMGQDEWERLNERFDSAMAAFRQAAELNSDNSSSRRGDQRLAKQPKGRILR